ncbi:MAG: hypothetical protein IJJ84_13665, partial [Kiritimatiellae bacterium]|nr:hypothetical protein [Kiritimatiellia bacterium]
FDGYGYDANNNLVAYTNGTGIAALDTTAGTVTITGGADVNIDAGAIGINGNKGVTVNGTTTKLDIDSNTAGISSSSGPYQISEADVTVDAPTSFAHEYESSNAGSAVSTGKYSAEVPAAVLANGEYEYLESGYYMVTETAPAGWVAFYDGMFYMNAGDAATAIAACGLNKEVYINEDANAAITDRIGDKGSITVYVLQGKSYTGTVSSTGMTVTDTVGETVTFQGNTYVPHTYTMAVDPAQAAMKIVKADDTETYYLGYANQYAAPACDGANKGMAAGVTLVLLKDCECSLTLQKNYDWTLDLNGHTFTVTSAAIIGANNTSTLTVVDSSDAKTGKIVQTRNSNNYACLRANGTSTINVYGGEYTGGMSPVLANGGTINIYGGTFQEAIAAPTSSGGTYVIYGGRFAVAPDSAYLAPSHAVSGPDGEGYYTVGAAVAKIGDTYYLTFAEAIAAADAVVAGGGEDPVITVLDATAAQTNPDWKIVDGKLVRKVYVAQIVINDGVTTNKYETLAEAIAAAENGDTVALLADIEVKDNTTDQNAGIFAINKSITIDGGNHTVKAIADGKSGGHVFTLTVKDQNTGAYASGDLAITIKDLIVDGNNVAKHGINVYGEAGHAITVSLNNVETKNNRNFGLNVNSAVVNAVNLKASGNGWGKSVGIDPKYQNASLTISGENTNLADTYSVDMDNSSTGDANAASVTITEGTYTQLLQSDSANTTFAVSGGTFTSAVPEQFCAAGYIPATLDPNTGIYSVKSGKYLAQAVTNNGATTNKFETLAEAIYAAYNGGTVTLLDDITVADWEQNVYGLRGSSAGSAPWPNGLVIDGDGHTLTVTSLTQNSINNGGHLLYKGDFTVKNLTVNLPAGATGFAPQTGSFENVTFNGGKRAMNLQYTTDTVAIDGCTFKNTSGAVFYTEGGTKVAVNDSIFESANLSVNGAWSFTSNTVTSSSFDIGAISDDSKFSENDLSGATVTLYSDGADLSRNYWGGENIDFSTKIASQSGKNYTAVVDDYYTSITKTADGHIESLDNIYELPYVATVTIGGKTKRYADLHEALVAGMPAGAVVTLHDDVDLTGVNWVPMGTYEAPFKGTLDGNGKVVSNLTISDANLTYAGLIGCMADTTIKSLTVSNVNITAKADVGGLVGCAYTGTIQDCKVTGT